MNSGNHILIVDDDEHIVKIIRFKLEKRGFHVESASNGLEALLEVENKKPDLIILDLMMPEMDGIEFNKILKSKKEFKDIPVFILTAKGQVMDKKLAFNIGVNDYITKPFSPSEVVGKVENFLRKPDPTILE